MESNNVNGKAEQKQSAEEQQFLLQVMQLPPNEISLLQDTGVIIDIPHITLESGFIQSKGKSGLWIQRPSASPLYISQEDPLYIELLRCNIPNIEYEQLPSPNNVELFNNTKAQLQVPITTLIKAKVLSAGTGGVTVEINNSLVLIPHDSPQYALLLNANIKTLKEQFDLHSNLTPPKSGRRRFIRAATIFGVGAIIGAFGLNPLGEYLYSFLLKRPKATPENYESTIQTVEGAFSTNLDEKLLLAKSIPEAFQNRVLPFIKVFPDGSVAPIYTDESSTIGAIRSEGLSYGLEAALAVLLLPQELVTSEIRKQATQVAKGIIKFGANKLHENNTQHSKDPRHTNIYLLPWKMDINGNVLYPESTLPNPKDDGYHSATDGDMRFALNLLKAASIFPDLTTQLESISREMIRALERNCVDKTTYTFLADNLHSSNTYIDYLDPYAFMTFAKFRSHDQDANDLWYKVIDRSFEIIKGVQETFPTGLVTEAVNETTGKPVQGQNPPGHPYTLNYNTTRFTGRMMQYLDRYKDERAYTSLSKILDFTTKYIQIPGNVVDGYDVQDGSKLGKYANAPFVAFFAYPCLLSTDSQLRASFIKAVIDTGIGKVDPQNGGYLFNEFLRFQFLTYASGIYTQNT